MVDVDQIIKIATEDEKPNFLQLAILLLEGGNQNDFGALREAMESRYKLQPLDSNKDSSEIVQQAESAENPNYLQFTLLLLQKATSYDDFVVVVDNLRRIREIMESKLKLEPLKPDDVIDHAMASDKPNFLHYTLILLGSKASTEQLGELRKIMELKYGLSPVMLLLLQ